MNYTVLLEGQLQDLSVETERLSTQLHSLRKQEGKLKNSKAELEQQVSPSLRCLGVAHIWPAVG